MKFLTILALIALGGCAQLTGPDKAEYTQENCQTHFRWDEAKLMNVVTHETCTKSVIKSNRVFENGILIEGNKTTGEFRIDTASVQNAAESSITQALAVLLAQPGFLDAILNRKENDNE